MEQVTVTGNENTRIEVVSISELPPSDKDRRDTEGMESAMVYGL